MSKATNFEFLHTLSAEELAHLFVRLRNDAAEEADWLVSMNKASERLDKYAEEWEQHPEHFEGVNPFYLAEWAIRQNDLVVAEKKK